MMFPELKRNEKDSMKASEAFFRGISRRIFNRPAKKVFIIGFHKTGTSSLGKALQILGYKVCGSLKISNRITEKNYKVYKSLLIDEAQENLKKYNAFQDTPWFLLYKELHSTFPDAYFILTKRNENTWIKSINKHFGDKYYPHHTNIYGTLDSIKNKEIYINRYREHNEKVEKYFVNNEKFLELDIKDFSWDVLCDFLNLKVPNCNFPHANKANQRGSFYNRIKKIVKKVYYN